MNGEYSPRNLLNVESLKNGGNSKVSSHLVWKGANMSTFKSFKPLDLRPTGLNFWGLQWISPKKKGQIDMLAANYGISSAWNAGTWPGFLSKSKSVRFLIFSALWREKNGCWFSGFVQVVPYQFQVALIDSIWYTKKNGTNPSNLRIFTVSSSHPCFLVCISLSCLDAGTLARTRQWGRGLKRKWHELWFYSPGYLLCGGDYTTLPLKFQPPLKQWVLT